MKGAKGTKGGKRRKRRDEKGWDARRRCTQRYPRASADLQVVGGADRWRLGGGWWRILLRV